MRWIRKDCVCTFWSPGPCAKIHMARLVSLTVSETDAYPRWTWEPKAQTSALQFV